MPVESLRDLADDVREVSTGATSAAVAAGTTIAEGTYTTASLGNVRATLTGFRGDIAEVRAELDALDVRDFIVHETGERVIALWTWERTVRHHLVRLDETLRRSVDTAETVALGIRRRTHVVRAGETLQAIAGRLLGDWREWTRIAEANGLTHGAVAAGTVLDIPDRR
jgi:nucleoid-associated protein YgaU